MKKSDWMGILFAAIVTFVIFGGVLLSTKAHKQPKLVSLSVNLHYRTSSAISDGVAKVSDDLKEYVGWGFWLQDRGLVIITETIGQEYGKNMVIIKGIRTPRKGELLLMNREAIKGVKRNGQIRANIR